MTISRPTFAIFDEIRQEINGDADLSQLRDAVRGGAKPPQWSVRDDLLLFKGRIFIASTSGLVPSIVAFAHSTGHEGMHKALHRLRADFHVPNDRVVVQDFVR